MNHLLGAHVSIAGGTDRAFRRAERNGCSALQIFTKNANQWKARPIPESEAHAFRQAWQESSIGPVIAHDAYLINLASPKQGVWEKSKAALRDEIERCALLGIPALVMHPGAHLGAGEQAGIERIRMAFAEILPETTSKVRILLENTAGQGSCIGYDFKHLADIMEGQDDQRFGVCFDTCHAHAAGYDLSSAGGYAETMDVFDRLIGVERLFAFHLNDCLRERGSRIDRHAHIGQGTIGLAGFACLMQDARFVDRPMILETPKGEDEQMDRINLGLLRELASGEQP